MSDNSEKLSILLVDDDKFLVDMYSMKFTAKGYNVNACLSAADALQVLRDGFLPQAIVFDLVMPEHDGFYFLKALITENLKRGASLIALTNESNDDTKAKITELGADRVIVKATMIPSEVVGTVEEEIVKKKKER
ncbi:MAG: response regulator [bacterium]|nr:response regulator [bacterium]